MSKRQRLAVAVGAAIIAIGAVAGYLLLPFMPPARRAAERRLRDELQTVALKNCTLRRYGGPNDGGYLMCENLVAGVESAYSYGIDAEDRWGCTVSTEQQVPIHQYDCFTSVRPSCTAGVFKFHDECIGPKRQTIDGNVFDTIAAQVVGNGDAGKRLLVKMDVEGAEWDALLTMPDEVLDRIDQLPMELHGMNEERFVAVIQRLKTKFHLVNLHFNNHVCTPHPDALPAWAFQVLFVNKRLGVLDASVPSPVPQSLLNAPDSAELPDCQALPPR